MANKRFFTNTGATTLDNIVILTGANVAPASDKTKTFSDVAPLDTAGASDISFFDNIKYLEQFTVSKAGACFVRAKFIDRAPKGMVLLVTDDPYSAYAITAQHFYPEDNFDAGISPDAIIAKDATIGSNTRIDAGAVIGSNVQIGDHCWIGANTVIDKGVSLGAHSRIGANCTISHSTIGERVRIHRGVHIGQDGFGFAPSPRGILKVPQLGAVVIGNDVEIGSGSCVDRGAGPNTIIGDSCKIDNLVQIGHNVQLGKYVVIAAQVGIAGSTRIDDGAMIGGQAGFSGHVHIHAGAKVMAQSGVMTDIPAGQTYGGSPAMPGREWHRRNVALAKFLSKRDMSNE